MAKERLESAKLDSPVKKPKTPSSPVKKSKGTPKQMIVKIAVGSSNPCKIQAVEQALRINPTQSTDAQPPAL